MRAATCDTSALVPALVPWHAAHDTAREALRGVAVVPVHVLLECYSVLTRLPPPHRIAAQDAAAVLQGLKLAPIGLPPARHRDVLALLGRESIRGGAVYDALVAATAQHHKLQLLTRDRRAQPAYDAVGVSYVLI